MVNVTVRNLRQVNLDDLSYESPERQEGYYSSEIFYLTKKEEEKKGETSVVLLDKEMEEVDKSQFLVRVKTKNHSELIKNKDVCYLDIYLTENDKLAEFVCDVDEHNVKVISENSSKWFKKLIPVDLIEQMYRSPLTVKKVNGKLTQRLRLYFSTHGESVQCEVYDQKKQLVSLDAVKGDKDLTLAISLDSLWINKKTAGCHWMIRQIKVNEDVVQLKKSKKIIGYALPSSDNEEED